MKTFATIFLTIYYSLLTINSFSQSCLPEGITFDTQEEIDNFQTNYPGCTEIEGDVTISGYGITNLNGLSVVTFIGGDLTIGGTLFFSNPNLTSLTGLDNLETIGGDLLIGGNDLLTSLSGLGNLASIGGNLSIGINVWDGIEYEDLGNNALTSLTGLNSVNSIGGNLYVRFNDALTSLSGIDNIAASTIGDISIYSNSSLTNCEVQNVCDYLVSPNGTVTIHSNATGCNNPSEVANACGITLPCLPFGNYYFYTQADIDNFQTNYPNCTAIEGYVEISGVDITNLDGLSAITSIGGDLTIDAESLTSMTGLGNLTYIGGSLIIQYNVGLTNLTGLNNVTSIGTDISIIHNGLSSLAGLEGLTSIGGSISIYDNDNLSTLSALENLITVGGSLSIGHFEDFQSLEIWYGNPSLPNLSGLDSLISIGEDLKIIYNESLTSLIGLDNLDSIGGDLTIWANSSLSVCEVQAICSYLANPNGEIDIWGNAPGCNSQDELEAACDAVTKVETYGVQNYSIIPNPVMDMATFSSEEITSFELYDMMGKMIIRQISNSINMTNLEPGIYFVIGFDKNLNPLYKGKIIKK